MSFVRHKGGYLYLVKSQWKDGKTVQVHVLYIGSVKDRSSVELADILCPTGKWRKYVNRGELGHHRYRRRNEWK